MKKGTIIFLFFTALVVAISSCSKNNLDQPGFPGLRCAPAGHEYVADTAYYIRNPRTTIYALTGNQTRIKFDLFLDTTGTVSLNKSTNIAYYLDGVNTYISTSGSMTITQYFNDSLRMVSGNFWFNGVAINDSTKTINIGYGYFNNLPKH